MLENIVSRQWKYSSIPMKLVSAAYSVLVNERTFRFNLQYQALLIPI